MSDLNWDVWSGRGNSELSPEQWFGATKFLLVALEGGVQEPH